MKSTPRLALLLGLFAPTATSGELAPGVSIAAASIERTYWDTADDGTIWVRGATYKASFGAGAATYIPFFGSRAPRNFPVTFRVEGATVDGAPLAFAPLAVAERRGDAVELDRASFVERYLVELDSIEQTFVFPERVDGEIVVTVAIETELARACDAEGFRFENDLGHVRYGRPFALDADGARVEIDAELAENAIRLRVPRDVVAAARFPLVIDPITTTFALDTALVDQTEVDTAYDASSQTFLTCFQESYSASDGDVKVIRHSASGTISADRYVDTSSEVWREPRIAHNTIAGNYLVVATKNLAPNRAVWRRFVSDTVSLAMSTKFPIVGGAGSEAYDADVGGDPTDVAPTYYCVVYTHEVPGTDSDVGYHRLNADGSVHAFGLIAAESVDEHAPSISNGCGMGPASERAWNMAWVHDAGTSTDIRGARVSATGGAGDEPFDVATTPFDEAQPSCSSNLDAITTGSLRKWAVAYAVDAGATNGWDVRVKAFIGALPIGSMDLAAVFPANASRDQTRPSIDTDGHQFGLAYTELVAYVNIYLATIAFVGPSLQLTEGDLVATPGSSTGLRPHVYARHSSGSSIRDALVVYQGSIAGAGQYDPYATLYDLPDGGAQEPYCFGTAAACPCGNGGGAGRGCASSVNAAGALLSSAGNACKTADTLILQGSEMPDTATCLYFQGTARENGGAGSVFGDGLRCAAGTVIRLGTKTNVGGVSRYPTGTDSAINVRGAIPADGAVRYYQAWYRNSAAFCTSSTFNLTNGMLVIWVP